MDPRTLKRDPAKIKSAIEVKGDIIKATKPIKIYIPARFKEKGLAVISNTVSIVGVFAYVVEDKYYAVSKALAMITITPDITNSVMIGDDEYMEFQFEAGATITPNKQLVQQGNIPYLIFDEFVSKGKSPWYIGYIDEAELMDTAKHHAGFNPGTDHAVLEMIVAVRARQVKDKYKYFRHVLKSPGDVEAPKAMIPLKSVQYGATNTTARLVGSYFDEGLTSALVNPSEKPEQIENLLRL
jgi:hypothetical protein